MGGRMWVESELGKGSRFQFTLEVQAAPGEPGDTGVGVRLQGRRMLIVDDNATNRRVLALQAKSWGMDSEATATGDQALEWLEAGRRFDVAVLDMQMPVMDGIELGRRIRRRHDHDDMPLVMLTSLGRHEAAADSVGFAAFLHKPSKASALYNALVGVLDAGTAPQSVKSVTTLDKTMSTRHPLRILVAEDNAVNQRVATSILAAIGYTCAIAHNGLEAVQAVTNEPYDVVLMDVLMPEMDGMRATRTIRALEGIQPQPRIIAMTANAMEGDRETCLRAGMDDYVSKPVRVQELIAALLRVPVASHAACPVDPSSTVEVTNAQRANPPTMARGTARVIGSQDADAALTALRGILGDQADLLLPELSELFQDEGPRLLDGIRDAIHNSEPQRLAAGAHTLKSSSASLGSEELPKICGHLEALGRSGTTIGAAAQLASLEMGYADFAAVLDLACASLATPADLAVTPTVDA
jgi:CheY-like chemotaxis protein